MLRSLRQFLGLFGLSAAVHAHALLRVLAQLFQLARRELAGEAGANRRHDHRICGGRLRGLHLAGEPHREDFFRGRRYEGDFRTTHTRAVLNSTLRGEGAEKELAQRQFQRVDANNKAYYLWQGVLLILRLFVTISIPACSYICLAITKMTNSTTADFFQKQIGDVFEYILYFPVYIERLAFAGGAMPRVGQLLEEMSGFEKAPVKTQVEWDKSCIALRDVTANPPVPLGRK